MSMKALYLPIRDVGERIFAAGEQKVSAELELSKPAPQTVVNNH